MAGSKNKIARREEEKLGKGKERREKEREEKSQTVADRRVWKSRLEGKKLAVADTYRDRICSKQLRQLCRTRQLRWVNAALSRSKTCWGVAALFMSASSAVSEFSRTWGYGETAGVA